MEGRGPFSITSSVLTLGDSRGTEKNWGEGDRFHEKGYVIPAAHRAAGYQRMNRPAGGVMP
jgi:hypothetical protein